MTTCSCGRPIYSKVAAECDHCLGVAGLARKLAPQETLPDFGLTLWQPMAGSIAHLGKRVENRGWVPQADVFGRHIAIHAADRAPVPAHLQLVARAAKLQPRGERIAVAGSARGAIVAVARLVGVLDARETTPAWPRVLVRGFSWPVGHPKPESVDWPDAIAERIARLREDPWWLGPVGWLLSDVRPMRTPIPAKGAQRLWRLSTDLRVAIARELEAA